MAASTRAAQALSFLKQTRGALTWTVKDLIKSLKINSATADEVLAVLQAQGYVKPAGREWLTTHQGEAVSGSAPPRFRREKVQRAVSDLRDRIRSINRDEKAPYKVTKAVAFGDFLDDRLRAQAADIGIQLVPRKPDDDELISARERASEQQFLKKLKGRSPLNMRFYEDWMSQRSHHRLV